MGILQRGLMGDLGGGDLGGRVCGDNVPATGTTSPSNEDAKIHFFGTLATASSAAAPGEEAVAEGGAGGDAAHGRAGGTGNAEADAAAAWAWHALQSYDVDGDARHLKGS